MKKIDVFKFSSALQSTKNSIVYDAEMEETYFNLL